MLRGTGVTSSVIHAAGAPGAGVSARPKALVVLVNTNLPTPAATASWSRVSVPVMFVSTKSWRLCEPTCGLCNVAGCSTAPTPARQPRTVSRSAMEPTVVVNGEGSRSRPTTSRPAARSTRISASPRCPALPVTRTRSPGMRFTLLSAPAIPRGVVGWSGAPTPDDPWQARPRRQGRGGVPLVRCTGSLSRGTRTGDDPPPGGDRARARGVPDHPAARRLAAGPGGGSDGGVRRPGYQGRAGHDRRGRPDHRPAVPRPRGRDGEPQGVPRLQRQRQPAQLAVVPRGRRVPRRLDHGSPRPPRRLAPCVHRVAAGGAFRWRRTAVASGGPIQRGRAELGGSGGAALSRADLAGPGLGVEPGRPGGNRADLGRQPGDPALDAGRRALDPAGRGLRRVRADPGNLRGDAVVRGGVPDPAQHGRARAARP